MRTRSRAHEAGSIEAGSIEADNRKAKRFLAFDNQSGRPGVTRAAKSSQSGGPAGSIEAGMRKRTRTNEAGSVEVGSSISKSIFCLLLVSWDSRWSFRLGASQEHPKSTPRAAKGTSKAPQEWPKARREPLKSAQEQPKSAKSDPKAAQEQAKSVQERTRASPNNQKYLFKNLQNKKIKYVY